MTDRTLSTTAQRTYWLGRYLERAGNTARLVAVNSSLLIDLPVRLPLGWRPLVDLLALEDEYNELYKHLGATDEKSVTRFLLSDSRHPNSVMSSLSFAKENARALRGTLPRQAFQHINDCFLYAKDAFAEPLSRTRRNNALQHTIERLHLIDGFLSSTMLHGAAWQFIRLGNFIERADMTTRMVELPVSNLLHGGPELEPYFDIQWRSVLNNLDALQGYTVSVQQPINQADVLEFLLKNSELPRSLLRSFNAIRNCLKSLPKNTEPLKQIEAMRRQLTRARVRTLDGERLHKFVDTRQRNLYTLHNKITNTYFPEI